MSEVKIVVDDRVFLLTGIENAKEEIMRFLDGRVNFLYFNINKRTVYIPRNKVQYIEVSDE